MDGRPLREPATLSDFHTIDSTVLKLFEPLNEQSGEKINHFNRFHDASARCSNSRRVAIESRVLNQESPDNLAVYRGSAGSDSELLRIQERRTCALSAALNSTAALGKRLKVNRFSISRFHQQMGWTQERVRSENSLRPASLTTSTGYQPVTTLSNHSHTCSSN